MRAPGADRFPPAPSTSLAGYATTWNNQQHVIYIDSVSGHVNELWYSDNGGWQHNDLTGLAPGADQYPPAPGTSLVGYVTPWNNQQHVIYIDSVKGHVNELWYSDGAGWQHNDLNDRGHADDHPPAPGSSLAGYVT